MEVRLPYGRSDVLVTGLPETAQLVLPPVMSVPAIAPEQLTQVLAEKLGHPIGAPKLASLLSEHHQITIVLPDKTRKAGQAVYLPALLTWLADKGVLPKRIRLLIGLGTHPPHAPEELDRLLTPEIHREWQAGARIAESSGGKSDDFVLIGQTARGTDVALHRWLVEPGLVIVTGSITYHYYAGYSGGRKGILPGCAASGSIKQSHQLAFRSTEHGAVIREPLAVAGKLAGNPIVEDQIEAALMLPNPVFLLNTITNPHDEIIDLVAGDLVKAHAYGITLVDQYYQAELPEHADLVIASAGGFPSDINLIQSHKALDNAVLAARPGARVLLLAECSQGTGNDTSLEWAALGSADAVLRRLGAAYEIVGGTVEGLLRKAEGWDVQLLTTLPPAAVRQFKMNYFDHQPGAPLDVSSWMSEHDLVAILPAAGITMPIFPVSGA